MTTLLLALPPDPLQFRAKALKPFGAMTLWLPEVALMPDHAPEAAQLVASVEVQVRVDAAPLVTLVGLALIESVAAWAVWAAQESTMTGSAAMRNVANKLRFHGAEKYFPCASILVPLYCTDGRRAWSRLAEQVEKRTIECAASADEW